MPEGERINLQADMVAAMKAGDTRRVSVLRMVLSTGNYDRINLQRELVDTDWINVLQKEAKKRREAIVSYESAGRTDQANQEKAELGILEEYLPIMLTVDQVKQEITDKQLLSGVTDFGGAMKLISPLFKGRADGQVVASVVKELLGK